MGEVFIPAEKKSLPVFQTFFPKISKDGKTTYYQTQQVIFIQEVKEKPKVVKPSEAF